MEETTKEIGVKERLSTADWWLDRACSDLYFLCRCLMQTLEDPTMGYKDLHEPTHRQLCDFVQKNAVEGQTCLILMPRHWLKSCIVTIGWSLQRMLINWRKGVTEHNIISNATIGNAKEFLWKIKYNFKHNEFLRYLVGSLHPTILNQLKDLENNAERWTQDEFQVFGNRIETGSVEGNLVSRHYKIMINDDLVNWDNSRTREQLNKVVDWWKLARSLLSPDGIEIIIGTRWDFDDLYGHIIEKFVKPEKDYHVGVPIVELHRGKYHLLQMDCWEDVENETGSTFPILFPEEKLKKIQVEQEDEFYGQYRNDPLGKGDTKYKPKDFVYYNYISDIPQIVNTVMLVDVTDKEKVTSDYSGTVVVDCGVDKRAYVRYGKRKKLTDMNLIDWIIDVALVYQPNVIGIESTKYNAIKELMELIIPEKIKEGEFSKDYVDYIRSLPYILHELKHRGRPKKIRVENMHGYVQAGKVLFPRDGAENLIEELIRLGKWKRDDVADAFGYLYDVLEWPGKTDPPKTLVVPEALKMTDEEKEAEEWEQYKREAYLGEPKYDWDDIY